MSSAIAPIAGNQNFTSVVEQAATLSDLTAADIHAASIDGNLTEFTVTGYAPLEFSTAGIVGGPLMTLNKAPGLPQTTAASGGLNDPNLLVLPSGSVPQAIYVTNNGTTITSLGGVAIVHLGLASIGGALTVIPPFLGAGSGQLLRITALNVGVANFGANNNGGPGGLNQGISARGFGPPGPPFLPDTALGGPGFSGYGVAGTGGVIRNEVPTVVTTFITNVGLTAGDLKVVLTCYKVPNPGI